MVISRTKFEISHDDIRRIFSHAGFAPVAGIRSLGAGEFNAVYAVEAGGQTYALKVGADNSAVMIYEKDMLKSELFWYQVIAERTDLRVPRVFFSDFTKTIIPTNYFIMEFIPGPRKDELNVTEAQRAKADAVIAGMIARRHRVRGEKFGYPQCGLHESWDIALEHMIQNLIRDAQKVNLALPRAEKVLTLIDRYRSVLSGAPCRLISFDAWEPNFICVPLIDRKQVAREETDSLIRKLYGGSKKAFFAAFFAALASRRARCHVFGELFAAEYMEVEMFNRLATVLAYV